MFGKLRGKYQPKIMKINFEVRMEKELAQNRFHWLASKPTALKRLVPRYLLYFQYFSHQMESHQTIYKNREVLTTVNIRGWKFK
jgi:hypothetical protein